MSTIFTIAQMYFVKNAVASLRDQKLDSSEEEFLRTVEEKADRYLLENQRLLAEKMLLLFREEGEDAALEKIFFGE